MKGIYVDVLKVLEIAFILAAASVQIKAFFSHNWVLLSVAISLLWLTVIVSALLEAGLTVIVRLYRLR